MNLNDLPPATAARLAGLERSVAGTLDDIIARLPHLERAGFGVADGIENPFLDVIARRAAPELDLPAVPVGVVSKRYRLLPHAEAATALRRALTDNGIDSREVRADASLSFYGARMALFLRLPRRFDFDPGDGHPLALRVLCFNSVDGSSPLRVLLGWYRYVCANGMAVGTTRYECRVTHRDDAMPEDIAPLLKAGLAAAEREKPALRHWTTLKISAPDLVAFADNQLAERWGVRAAARFLHIATTGFDAEPAQPFESGLPHAKSMRPTRRVPGSPLQVRTVYDASQALTWLARDRRDPREAADWMVGVAPLMRVLARDAVLRA